MARINIEECWWADLRRSKLIKLLGDEDLADAAAIRMWRLAQDFWKDGRRLVPTHIWEHFKFGKECIEAGLAIVQDAFIYVRGSSEHLEWAAEQRENARKAGKKSAEVRKAKSGTSQPVGGKGHNSPEISERQPNDNRTESNGTEPSGSGSVSGSGSGSVSGSNSGSVSVFEEERKKRQPKANAQDSNALPVVQIYCDSWKARYGTFPPITGKVAGQIKGLVKDQGIPRAIELIQAYLDMPDQWFITRRHDIGTLINNLNSVAQFADTGRQITRKEAHEADSAMSLANQLRRIEEGKI